MSNSSKYSSVYQSKYDKRHLASSRLVKKEKNKLQKQTIGFLFFGIAILLLFIFIIVPNLIRLFFAIIDKDSPFVEADIVPPQVPVLASTPVEATFSATLNLTGFAEADSTVVFLLNSTKSGEVKADGEGNFTHELALSDGLNELSIFGLDAAGNESLKTRTYLIERDSEPPFLELEEPKDGAVIELKKNRTLTIKGKTEPGARLLVNDRLVLADSEGNFSTNYYLAEGKNELKFIITDKATNRSERTVEVEFRL